MRFRVLDSWRGIAALFVAAFHFRATWHFHESPLIQHSFLFVDFFVLSGFVIAHAYRDQIHTIRDLGSFILRRFGRLWPLSAFVLLAFGLLECLKLVAISRLGLHSGVSLRRV